MWLLERRNGIGSGMRLFNAKRSGRIYDELKQESLIGLSAMSDAYEMFQLT